MRGDIGRWVFFMLSYFVLVFWLIFFNAFHLISAAFSVCCCFHHGEKRLVNSITFLVYFIGTGIVAVAAWRRGCTNSSMVVVTSSTAEVEFQLKCIFRNSRGMTPTAITDTVRGVAGRGILCRHHGRGGRGGMGRRMITSLEISRVCFEVQ
jgi:hypothetical protein